MAAIQNASEKEYKKAIEAHPDLVNLDRPELFVKMLRQEIKNNPFPRRAMKSTLSYLLILCSLFMSCTGHQEESLLSYVDTRTGTAPSITHTAGLFGKNTEEYGQTLPAVLEPNGMNFWTPQTQDTEIKCKAPYYYKDKKIQGFRNSH